MTATVTPYFGADAIAYAKAHGMLLNRYGDSTGPAREGLSVAEAEEIAARDPALIYLHVRGLEPA